ncbi:MAG: polyprenyl synthetase family protein [Bacteroidota bacterium]|nr:polyprenyl synthetase family protein [Candidatus Kapabacteria bacterium]MDW8219369.1 polyprenyl synthetase family protein [Bacteroidota bacterium]
MHHYSFTKKFSSYKHTVESALAEFFSRNDFSTNDLYKPIRYTMLQAGKRIRPVLTMIACDAVGGNAIDAVFAGMAVEMLHTFTLIHDDIMDDASIRRGFPTIHVQWDTNTAILSGDALIAVAYSALMQSPSTTQRIAEMIAATNAAILRVCEGQALDLALQRRTHISLDDYFAMIDKKTATMLGLCVQLGAIVGNACTEYVQALTHYARATGIAFQIHDDLLDIIADSATFGKPIGSDIVEGKKTFLIAKALAQYSAMNDNDRALIDQFLHQQGLHEEYVPRMKEIFARYGILDAAYAEIARRTEDAHRALTRLPHNEGTASLHDFATMLLERTY